MDSEPESQFDSAGQPSESAFSRSMASEIISTLRVDQLFQTKDLIEKHRHVRVDDSLVINLLYEEYCRKDELGITPTLQSLIRDFPHLEPEMSEILKAHKGFIQAGMPSSPQEVHWPKVGDTLHHFQLCELLGKGAFARAYLARQRNMHNREVVLKITPFPNQEADIHASFHSDAIIPILDSVHFREERLFATVMPYYGKTTLHDLFKLAFQNHSPPRNCQPLANLFYNSRADAWRTNEHSRYLEWVIEVGIRLAEALHEIHQHKVIHCDLKPSNVIVCDTGRLKLIDFNLSTFAGARALRLGGTLPFMSPEQLQLLLHPQSPHQLDYHTDIYSFGVIMHLLTTGKLPFGSASSAESRNARASKLRRRQ